MEYPETPQAIALALLMLILMLDPLPAGNQTVAARVLALYSACLDAASGDREGETRH